MLVCHPLNNFIQAVLKAVCVGRQRSLLRGVNRYACRMGKDTPAVGCRICIDLWQYQSIGIVQINLWSLLKVPGSDDNAAVLELLMIDGARRKCQVGVDVQATFWS